MPYTDFEEVQADFKNTTFTATSNVTDEDVTQFITEADALINSFVGKRYVTPVTGSGEGLSLLKLYSRSLVANRIKGIMEVKQATNSDANQNVRSGLSTSAIIKLLEGIRDGENLLPGAELLGSVAGSFYSSNAANSVDPYFKKDRKQW